MKNKKETEKIWVEVDDESGYWIEKKLDPRISESYNIPAKCSLCTFPMRELDDAISYTSYECCSKCYVQFVEGRKDRWNSGWRPEKEELSKFIEKRKFFKKS
jgi:hypothetical protein|tara:strand:+ start:18245 stop:18550 length:306 start_codon:yes stop_codon:yes gene_type:complete